MEKAEAGERKRKKSIQSKIKKVREAEIRKSEVKKDEESGYRVDAKEKKDAEVSQNIFQNSVVSSTSSGIAKKV